MSDIFGDRMKKYEQIEAGRIFLPNLPILVRIDGKGFSKYTKKLNKPYDIRFSDIMINVTKFLVKQTNACIGYTQSDEITLVLYAKELNQEIFFAGKIQKMVSIISSMATAKFNQLAMNELPQDLVHEIAFFDCRVWQLPNKTEAANAVYWREVDATKNSISTATRAYYTASEIHLKNSIQMKEMLMNKGVNWNDYPNFFKHGTFVATRSIRRNFTEEELSKIPKRFIPSLPVMRNEVIELDMPPFGTVKNREQVIFDGELPNITCKQYYCC